MINTALSVTTDFSLGESVLSIDRAIARAKELELPIIGVCDTMSISSLITFAKKAKKADLDVIAGVRLRLVDDPCLKDKEGKNQSFYCIKLYPKTYDGMKRVMRLLTLANSVDRFYYRSRLGLDDVLSELGADDLLVTTGDVQSALGRTDARDIVSKIVARHGARNTLVELVPAPTPYFDRVNATGLDLAPAFSLRTIVTYPTFYATPVEADALPVLNALARNVKFDKGPGVGYFETTKSFCFLSREELLEKTKTAKERSEKRFPHADQSGWRVGIANTTWFINEISYRWEKMPVALPVMSPDPDTELAAECVKGWKERFGRHVFAHQPTADELRELYKPRLVYELDVLRKLGFGNYFLMVQDVIRWSKSNQINVGPGRGSIGGSLVAYLMGITDIDPIRFGLLFERFINPDRIDLPDADLDFMSTRRQEVVAYLRKRFGEDKVAGVSNYNTLASGSAIRDVGRVFGLSQDDLSFTKLVPKIHGQPVELEVAAAEVAEINAFRTREPGMWAVASQLEGAMRSYGTHAAGLIVSEVPLVERAVVECRDGEPVINWDKSVSEEMGLVKLDVLGLSTLDTFARAVEYIWRRHTKRIDLLDVPLDDPKVLEKFSSGDTVGVFQFEGGSVKRILKDMAQTSPLTFDDLVAANALNRPGPIDAGLVDQYVAARNGYEVIAVEHPNMAEALKDTFNVICYQEQVMRIATDLCGFRLAEADVLRKAMGKKDPVLMAEQKDKFVKGAVSHSGMDELLASALFGKIEQFAGYAFNKSHAAAYSLIAYQAMWLKTYFPVEFFAASLSTVGEDKLSSLVRNAEQIGIKVLPPDINQSSYNFEILNDTSLLVPFNRLKGLSDKTAEAIMTARSTGPFTSKQDFLDRVEKRRCNVKHTGILDTVGAFARIEPGQLPADHVDRVKEQIALMPGLVARNVQTDRDIPVDKVTLAKLKELIGEWEAADPRAIYPVPFVGKKARFMVIADCPSKSEEAMKKMTEGRSFEYCSEALIESGLQKQDGYWTSLCKRPKTGKALSTEEIGLFQPFLEKEIELLKPPVIIALGSVASRYFIPDLKGNINDHAGRTEYLPKYDATVIVGFNPASIFHDTTKQFTLNEIFQKAKELLE